MMLSRRFLLVAGPALLAGCASGPKMAEMRSIIPPVPAGMGRIYVYRPSSFGFGLKPDVMLNGQRVATSEALGFFFIDRPPGTYEVSTSTEVERKASFALAVGETKYVRTSVSLGVLVGRLIPELVTQAEGEKEMADLSWQSEVR